MSPMIFIWIGAVVALVVLEAVTAALVSIWFIGGAVAALIVALCGGAIWLQVLLFAVVSVGLLVCLRPFLHRHTNPKKLITNVDANIGKTAVVTQTIDNLHGQGHILVGSVDWSARSMENQIIPVGTRVVVRKIEGVKALVELEQVPAAVGK